MQWWPVGDPGFVSERIKAWSDDELTRKLALIDEGLSEWEVEFVNSIRIRVKTGRDLTPKQRERAQIIAEQKL